MWWCVVNTAIVYSPGSADIADITDSDDSTDSADSSDSAASADSDDSAASADTADSAHTQCNIKYLHRAWGDELSSPRRSIIQPGRPPRLSLS